MMGTASAMPVVERNQSAQVLNVHGRLFLIDCGENVQQQMVRYRVPMMKIEALMISHIHGDHVFGFMGLLSTMGMKARTAPLTIYAPPAFGPMLKFFLSYYGDGVGFEIRFVPLRMKAPELLYSCKGFEILALPLNHGIETFGFIFRERPPMWNVRKEAIGEYGLTLSEIGALKRGDDVVREDRVISHEEAAYIPFVPRSYAYISDTAVFPEEKLWLQGVTTLYHETTYLSGHEDLAEQRHHTTTLQAARLAMEIKASKLITGHYSSRDKAISSYQAECRSVFPESYAASDGDIFEIV